MEQFSASEIARFWSRVSVGRADECWEWERGKQGAGYGAHYIDDGTGRRIQMLAHRISCTIAHGAPPEGKPFALHSCDNPPCCNPHHLRWGSNKDNTDDAIERDRATPPPNNSAYRRRDTQPKGAHVWNQTLTETKVREIWSLHLEGGISIRQIAERVGAKPHAVADVARGRSWRHLEGAPTIAALKAGGVRRGSNGFNEAAKAAKRIDASKIKQARALIARRVGSVAIARETGISRHTVWRLRKGAG